ncbi:short-chain dehydrogenase/reductase SDR [Planoprotostelium fungivorum]|uniref:Short-chain dehydrogenase/reductase SDR n=1 Tax=Planoprotostelium fungivorum TaxID=1890364 RepID=A0A2P6NA71_9EUKA|nr:short-chain dehydrogenase/reductase SDR [Planoprotostelium fungivorum]
MARHFSSNCTHLILPEALYVHNGVSNSCFILLNAYENGLNWMTTPIALVFVCLSLQLIFYWSRLRPASLSYLFCLTLSSKRKGNLQCTPPIYCLTIVQRFGIWTSFRAMQWFGGSVMFNHEGCLPIPSIASHLPPIYSGTFPDPIRRILARIDGAQDLQLFIRFSWRETEHDLRVPKYIHGIGLLSKQPTVNFGSRHNTPNATEVTNTTMSNDNFPTQDDQETKMNPPPLYDGPFYKGSGKLKGKKALITGGDSGIGRSISVFFAREGADVSIVYLHSKGDAEDTVKLVEKEGTRAISIQADVGKKAQCEEVVKRTVQELGGLDIVVNHAGTQFPAESLLDIQEDNLRRVFEVNVFSQFFICQAALPHLKKGSSIINTSSVNSFRGLASMIDYSATKGANTSFTYSLAQSLAPQGIRVNQVAPGPIWTPSVYATMGKLSKEKFQEMEPVPLGRVGEPQDLGAAYVYLASEDSAYVTGQTIHVNGGLYLLSLLSFTLPQEGDELSSFVVIRLGRNHPKLSAVSKEREEMLKALKPERVFKEEKLVHEPKPQVEPLPPKEEKTKRKRNRKRKTSHKATITTTSLGTRLTSSASLPGAVFG